MTRCRNCAVLVRSTIHNNINKFEETGSALAFLKCGCKPKELTEEKLDNIGVQLEKSPKMSLKWLAQDSGISKKLQDKQQMS